MKTTILERIYKRLLHENVTDEDLAAYVRDLGNSKQAIIYEAEALQKILNSHTHMGRKFDIQGISDAIVGYIIVQAPQHPCGGAWEVKAAWGPGRGKIVYAIGHALSPNGILMPDRAGVSASARRGWAKQMIKGRNSIPLDNITAHQNNEPHPNHTEDPEDDCTVHGIESLDRAYLSTGEETSLLRSFINRDTEITSNLPPNIVEKLRTILRSEGVGHFAGNVR